MSEEAYEKTPLGQLVYDLCFTDLTPKYLAKKHKMTASEIFDLRVKSRKAMLGKRRLTKAQRDRAVASAKALNAVLDAHS